MRGFFAAFLVTVLLASPALAQGCQTDGDIPPLQRDAIQTAALAMAGDILGPNPGAMYDQMTKAAQATFEQATMAPAITALLSGEDKFWNIRVTHAYFIDDKGSGANTIVSCSAGDASAQVIMQPGVVQAHIVVLADSKNNSWAMTFWMSPEDGTWRARNMHLTGAAAGGRTPEDFLALARKERDGGHLFNATLLYAAAEITSYRGPTLHLPLAGTVAADESAMSPPPELTGKPPHAWSLDGKTYSVGHINTMGIGKDLGVAFDLPQSDWPGDDVADQRNRDFLTAFIKAHPDWTDVYSFLVARAIKPDSSGGFNTVYEKGKGFR